MVVAVMVVVLRHILALCHLQAVEEAVVVLARWVAGQLMGQVEVQVAVSREVWPGAWSAVNQVMLPLVG